MSKIDDLIKQYCPDGVEYKELGVLCEVDTGEQLNKELLFDTGRYPVMNGGMYPSGRYDEYNIEADNIAVSQGGASAGFVNWMAEHFWSGAHCYTIIPNDNSIIKRYLYHILKHHQQEFMSSQQGAGIPSLSRKKLNTLKIPVPPLPVQVEIVKVLDTFTELEKELEKRKQQYEYYRDQLLTPENMNGEVQWKTLGEIGTFIRGNGLQKKDFTEDGVGCIHYGQLYTYYGTFTNQTKTFVSNSFKKI